MTEDQIKAIAYEYAEYYAPVDFRTDVSYTQLFTEAKSVLDFISKYYSIVEMEKVMEKYNAIKFLNEVGHQDRLDLLEDLFGTSMFNSKEAAEYTEQCKTCMRRLSGEVLEVCKDSTDESRHCQWNCGKNQDFCAYKIFWDRYPEAHWQTILTPEQFAKAKSLNQKEE